MRRVLFIAALLSATATATVAQPVEKDGLPCVAEVCLGDGLEALAGIDWQPALSPRGSPAKPLRVRDRVLETADRSSLARLYRGVPANAEVWLADRKFDREGLRAITGVKAACAEHWVDGHFVSAGGNPTTVMIKRLPDAAGGQRWTVVAIRRVVAGAVTTEQRREAEAALKERYAAFDLLRRPRSEASQRATFQMATTTTWGFTLNLAGDPQLAEKLRSQAACGGTGNKPATLD
jgi:hypothetical protein